LPQYGRPCVIPFVEGGISTSRHQGDPAIEPSDHTVVGGTVADVAMAAYDAHQRALTSFAYSLTRDREAAEDLVQEAFVRLINELQKGRQPENIQAWLFRVCSNLVVSGARRRNVAQRFIAQITPRDVEVDADAEDTMLRREMSGTLLDALDRLSVDARVALVLAAHGFSGREIATALGRTETSTRTMMFRAREQMRVILVDQGVHA
jgi:RNA polymerase sigma-70 factor (ECF subfamily)